LTNVLFVVEELPIRLAHRVKELEELPPDIRTMPSILKVKHWYAESFQVQYKQGWLKERTDSIGIYLQDLIELRRPKATMIKSPSTTHHRYYTHTDASEYNTKDHSDYDRLLTQMLETIKRRHDPVVTTMAQGILEYKATTSPLSPDQIDFTIQTFLDRFYMSRMGIRMLIGQHLSLHQHQQQQRPHHVGVICTKANIKQIAQNAIAQARHICQEHYGLFQPPAVRMFCPADIEFMYVPSHLEHILFELVKNALRAVVERFSDLEADFPPIQMVIAYGREDVTIKISDQGGGIARSRIPLVWTYMVKKKKKDNRWGRLDYNGD
jgi:pyruvate dehydrogenase kinase 2/3/4